MKKTFKSAVLILAIVMLHLSAFGQKAKLDASKADGQAVKSEIFKAEFVGKRNPVSADLDWFPNLTHKVTKVEHGFPGFKEAEEKKAELYAQKYTELSKVGEEDEDVEVFSSSTPIVGNEFSGNPFNGFTPLDNDIAVSNDDIIISVANATIQYKRTTGATTFASSLTAFVGDPGITNICDPLIHYDPVADRFIFFAQECSGNSANSFLLIMFSETNDPADGWNYYKVTGNPLDDNSWFDYPKMAISENDLFITGNLFSNSFAFNESVIYQFDKNDGYAGDELTWQFYSGIPGSPFTILPVSSGNEFNYGPGIYAIAVSPFSGNAVRLFDITDDISGDPELNLFTVFRDNYNIAADSDQAGTGCQLDNGDCRALSGFYLDGVIHYVHHTNADGGWNGINYNRLTVDGLENETALFEDVGSTDYSYPSIAWFGTSPSDRTVMIGFGSVSPSTFPEISAVQCDNEMNFSEPTLVRESASFVCGRWGDYTGISRKHDAEEPTVWINGMVGTTSNRWTTWIAEISANFVAGVEEEVINDPNTIIAPNPIGESFVLSFDVQQDVNVNVQIIGIDGKLVKELYKGRAYTGENKFTFNKSNLSRGTYFLQILSENEQLANEKIIIN